MSIQDVLDENGNPTGETKTKAEIHEQGLWHRAAHVWVYDSGGNILLQLRAKDKDSSPGLWDISAAGHVDAGESPLQSATREINEEIGLDVSEHDLQLVWERKQSTYTPDNGWQNNQLSSEYILRYDGEKDRLVFQPEEIDELKWVAVGQFKHDVFDPEMKVNYVAHGDEYYRRIISEIEKALAR